MRDGSNESQALVPVGQAGAVVRQEFAAQEIQRVAESSATAVAAQARAQVEARYLMAERHPRDWNDVRANWLRECERPTLAEVAIWKLKIGGKELTGPSIRLAEVALRCMKNVLPETTTVYDDPEKRIVRVSVTDLESNLTYSKDVVIEKLVERKSLKQGQKASSQRINSSGEVVYRVEASEGDLLAKQGAAESKALRVLALRLFPGDILEEGIDVAMQVRADKFKRDPDASKKKLLDAFSKFGIKPSAIKDYIGHDLDGLSPAEYDELSSAYVALRDSAATWADLLEAKTGVTTAEKGPADTAALAATLEKKRAERAAKKDPPPISDAEAAAIRAEERGQE